MITVKEWTLKIRKDGTPVVFSGGFAYQPFEYILPSDNDIKVLQEGLVIKHRDREFLWRFDSVFYPKVPTTLQKQIEYGIVRINSQHILHFFYELISGVLNDKCTFIRTKEPFNIENLVERYSKYQDKIEGINLSEIIEMIPNWRGK